ncbi:TlpA family protein disulfide reductase [Antrihabitans cavernicola]|uniref:Redoxin domain-containing protein n=1 Tax=Antrihabitans cavernicola TaxID=2495913 RepID=A0A5A7SIB1_9NOCA|nr:TlpA disulfide reductase family protein [Spelaeibacter cavernicola]KAA0024467.1 redoxin domain-containing protein [Spelaeibacter cavernicola]
MRISNTARWSLAALVVVIALIVAIWPRGHDQPDRGADVRADTPSAQVEPVDPALAAQLAPCPQPAAGARPANGPLAGLSLTCLHDGVPIDLGSALAGKPALINLWAYWCAPCAQELPILADFAARTGGAVNVLTVHSDPSEAKALARLADLSVRLPGFQDGDSRLRTAVSAPPVLPVSVLIRADGSVAEVVAHPFASVDEIAAEVQRTLGVSV